MGAETQFYITIGPTNASFYNVTLRENCQPTTTVTWPNKTVLTYDVDHATGSFSTGCDWYELTDTVSTPGPKSPSSLLFNGTNYVNFSCEDSWTYQYQNFTGAWISFHTCTSTCVYNCTNFQAQVTYCGIPGHWQGPF
jgi:hypothetical protein